MTSQQEDVKSPVTSVQVLPTSHSQPTLHGTNQTQEVDSKPVIPEIRIFKIENDKELYNCSLHNK